MGSFEHTVASGQKFSLNGETADVRWVIVYGESDNVDLDDLEDWVEANEGDGDPVDNVFDISYSQNGPAGVIDGTIDTDDI